MSGADLGFMKGAGANHNNESLKQGTCGVQPPKAIG